MKFCTFWAHGEATVERGRLAWKIRTYGGSNQSLEDAQRKAREVAERTAAALAAGRPPNDYAYADRPLREEIIQELQLGDERIGVISRNAYGSLILNSARAMFVDVDYEPNNLTVASIGNGLKSLWGKISGRATQTAAKPAASRDAVLLERFERVVRAEAGLGIRVYRTAGGFRLLATSGPFEPNSDETARLLVAFGSDPLYSKLCSSPQCFRARISAKYWRCGADKPPARLPWADAAEEARYREWEQAYHSRANQWSTCAHIADFGESVVAPCIAPILEIHDRLAINGTAPLG